MDLVKKLKLPKLFPKIERFYVNVTLIAVALTILWGGKNLTGLIGNLWRIRVVDYEINRLETRKRLVSEELSHLKGNDPVAWDRVYRQELHAIKPGELEYRFK